MQSREPGTTRHLPKASGAIGAVHFSSVRACMATHKLGFCLITLKEQYIYCTRHGVRPPESKRKDTKPIDRVYAYVKIKPMGLIFKRHRKQRQQQRAPPRGWETSLANSYEYYEYLCRSR